MTAVAVAHNDGNSIRLRPAPVLSSDPFEETAYIWISAPDTADKPEFQGVVRESSQDAPATTFSTLVVKAWWEDTMPRRLCAQLGDPPTSAPYEAEPTADACGLPWTTPGDPPTLNGRCDNQEDFVAGEVGTPAGSTNGFESCPEQPCGAGRASPCTFEFRITKQYAGDNYRVYLYQPGSPDILRSAAFTAWKRAYVEHDFMAQRGGMLWENGQQNMGEIKIRKDPVNGLPPYGRMDNLTLNDIIHVFDAAIPFNDPGHDLACVRLIDESSFTNYVLVTLGEVVAGACTSNPYTLHHTYIASPWDFSAGQSAGVAVADGGFFAADPSRLNSREGQPGPFDDAYVSFRMHSSGVELLPYLPGEWFLHHLALADAKRFHKLWFQNQDPTGQGHNYFHLVGASQCPADPGPPAIPGRFGGSYSDSDVTYVFNVGAQNRCGVSVFPAPDLGTCIANITVTTTDHELAHQLEVNLTNNCSSDPGHDPGGAVNTSNLAWCTGQPGCVDPALTETRCLMSGDTDDNPANAQAPQIRDQVNRMECEDLGMPTQVGPCQYPDCGLGARNQIDPK